MKLPLFSYKSVIDQAEHIQRRYYKYVRNYGTPYYIPEKGLGWTIAPNARHRTLNATSDSMGFRRTSNNPIQQESSQPRISFWGCSIVEGCEISDDDTWLWQLQEKLKDRFVIYNGGVSAYGTDQAYLRYTKRFDDIKPEMSFLGYATTDLIRNLSIQRMLLMGHSDEYLFLKPRFVLKSNQLELISPPETNFENLTDVLKSPETKRLLKQYDPFFEKCSILKQLIAITIRQCGFNIKIPLRIKKLRAEALRIVFGIIKKFIEFSRQRKTDGIILFLPIFRGAYKTGNDFDTLIHMLDRHGYPYVDLRNVFSDIERHDMEDFLTPKNHYTRLSGDWISDYLSDYITRRIGNTQRS